MTLILPADVQRTALKEWASVCHALLIGKQVLLFRKGGIIERNGEFELETPSFFVYPTFLHQDESRLQPEYAHFIEEAKQYEIDEHHVQIALYCKAEQIYQARHITTLEEHPEWYIWRNQHIQDTWQWKPEKPAYIILVRAYKISLPFIVESLAEYGGCVSWIDLQQAIPELILKPVIPDNEFNELSNKIKTILHTSEAIYSGGL